MTFYKKILRINDYFYLYKSYFYRRIADKKIKFLMTLNEKDQKKNNKNGILADAMWDHPHHWLRLAIFKNATKNEYGKKISFVIEEKTNKRIKKSAISFDPEYFFTIPNKIEDKIVKRSIKIAEKIKINKDIFKIKFGNKYPSHFFYDSVLKELKVGSLDLKIHGISSYIAKTIHMIVFYNKIFKQYKFSALVVSHPTTIRFSTLIWSALNNKIPVFIINYRNTFVTIRKIKSLDELNTNPEDNPTMNDFNKISRLNKDKLILSGKKFLQERFKSHASEISITTKNKMKSKIMSKLEIIKFLGLSNKKKTIVVFCNCWPDFPNAQGISHFDDHEEFFKFTLDLAINCTQFNWVFKAHPAEYMYGKKTTLKKFMTGINYKHIKSIYSEIDWNSTLSIMDCAVTSTGSIGHEYVALGGLAIISRPNAYTSMGFSHFANSKDEYKSLLINFEKLNLPSKEEQEKALIYTALKFGSASNNPENELVLPLGRLSYKIWPTLKSFIELNDKAIQKETNIIKKFIISKCSHYSIFKYL